MKHNIWSIIYIVVGIIFIVIGLTSLGNQIYTNLIVVRIIILGIILIILSLIGRVPNRKSDNKKDAEKFNFRETDADENCSKCNRFDKKYFDGYEANCKFFHVKSDRNHVCDLLYPQLIETDNTSYTSKSNKPKIMNHEDLLRKLR
jgi:hypothetical protein